MEPGKAGQDFANGFWRIDGCHDTHPAKTARAFQNVQSEHSAHQWTMSSSEGGSRVACGNSSPRVTRIEFLGSAARVRNDIAGSGVAVHLSRTAQVLPLCELPREA